MFTISLNNLQFFSHHGLYDEEKKLGNTYEVNLAITIDIKDKITSVDQTVDYVSVFELVKARMAIPTELLETVAQDLVMLIRTNFLQVTTVSVNIQKKNPPIENFEGSVSVTYKKDF